MNTLVNIMDVKSVKIYNISMFELYYNNIQLERKLTFSELLKYFLYKLLSKIDK